MSMLLAKEDKVFLDIINTFSDDFEDIIDKSLDYKINFKLEDTKRLIGKVEVIDKNNNKTTHTYAFLSIYNRKNNEYKWLVNAKSILKQSVQKVYTEFNIKLDTINKLFDMDRIILDKKYKSTIPYIIASIYQKNINIIRLISGDIEIYIAIDLNIPLNKISMDKISDKLQKYNNLINKN